MSDSESKIIDVSMGDMKAAASPHVFRASGIGSCIVITLYDSIKKVGAIAHPMLAKNTNKKADNLLRYVDSAIETMIEELQKLGVFTKKLQARIIGGANMFKVLDKNPESIGAQNVEAAVNKLKKEGIKIVATDTGENCGRSVTFDLSNGVVEVKTKI